LYSSFASFLKNESNEWLDTRIIISEFEKMANGKWSSYKEFVNDEKVVVSDWLVKTVPF
jgi:hypothetical protein